MCFPAALQFFWLVQKINGAMVDIAMNKFVGKPDFRSVALEQRRAQLNYSATQVRDMFEKYDKNSDGVLDLPEARDFIFEAFQAGPSMPDREDFFRYVYEKFDSGFGLTKADCIFYLAKPDVVEIQLAERDVPYGKPPALLEAPIEAELSDADSDDVMLFVRNNKTLLGKVEVAMQIALMKNPVVTKAEFKELLQKLITDVDEGILEKYIDNITENDVVQMDSLTAFNKKLI